MPKVEFVDLFFGTCVALRSLTNQDQEGERPIFMYRRPQEHPDITEGKSDVLLAQPVHYCGGKTQKNVTFAILARARLEESSRLSCTFGRTKPAQLLLDKSGCHLENPMRAGRDCPALSGQVR